MKNKYELNELVEFADTDAGYYGFDRITSIKVSLNTDGDEYTEYFLQGNWIDETFIVRSYTVNHSKITLKEEL